MSQDRATVLQPRQQSDTLSQKKKNPVKEKNRVMGTVGSGLRRPREAVAPRRRWFLGLECRQWAWREGEHSTGMEEAASLGLGDTLDAQEEREKRFKEEF